VADNVVLPPTGSGDATPKVATEQVAGTLEHKQFVELAIPGTGRTLIPADAANGLDVDVTRVTGVVHVDDNAGLLSVDDGAGSLTVDAPVGTPVFVRLSDGTAVLVGQKVMASSLPVVVASDQSVIPVSDNAGSLTVDAPVGTPAFVRLSDGAAALVGQKTMALSLPVALASDQSVLPAVTERRASILAVTATGAAAAAVTLTLPAVASQFHYITEIQIVKFATALLTAAATPVLVTTTNFPAATVFSFSAAASAQGTNEVQQFQPSTPLRSAVVNTATTIVCPATTATIWRVNVWYWAAI
jgi:hypothetical protein